MPRKNIILISLSALVLTAAAYFLLTSQNYSPLPSAKQAAQPLEVTLEFWGVWDNSDSWQQITDRFESETHDWNGREVKVKVNYTKKDIASYEADLQQAYAENKSPSVYLINNYWLERYADQLEPLSGNAAYVEEYGLLNYEELEGIFPNGILLDAYHGDNTMYALPIYSDTLALYYNKDLFQKAGIASAPTTWDELKADVKKLTVLDKKNVVQQSGIALGGGKGVNRSCDILSLLTLQSGGKMIDTQGTADFNRKLIIRTPSGEVESEPGLTAIQFYMEFSDPNKEIYTWNSSLPDSLQAFAAGKTAMMFGYSYQKANLLALKPELNYGIAPTPQNSPKGQKSIANYWMPVVSNQKSCAVNGGAGSEIDCTKVAWSFLSFANEKENIATYLSATGKASARLDLIAEQSTKDDLVAAFAKQATIDHSYSKFDDRIDGALTDMLEKIYADRTGWRAHADTAAAEIAGLKTNAN